MMSNKHPYYNAVTTSVNKLQEHAQMSVAHCSPGIAQDTCSIHLINKFLTIMESENHHILT